MKTQLSQSLFEVASESGRGPAAEGSLSQSFENLREAAATLAAGGWAKERTENE